MRYIASVAVLLAALGWVGQVQAQVCRPADVTSGDMIGILQRYAGATSGGDKTVRDSLHLPLVSSSQVVLVTAESVCKKANQAYQGKLANTGGSPFSGKVYVVQVGSSNYAVMDPAFNYGNPRFWTIVVLDSRYKPLSIL